jgi:hypothetical protein
MRMKEGEARRRMGETAIGTQDPVGRKSRRGETDAISLGWIAPDLSHACGLHRPRMLSFSGLSKPGEVVHPRSGSKPARNSFSG